MNPEELKEFKTDTGSRIRQLREAKAREDGTRITQEDAAEAVGVRLVTYGKWERGQALPAFDRALALSEYLGVSLDHIAGQTEQGYLKRPRASKEGAKIPWKSTVTDPERGAASKAIDLFEKMASGKYESWEAFLTEHDAENKPEVLHLIELAIWKGWVQILQLPPNTTRKQELVKKFNLRPESVAVPEIPHPFSRFPSRIDGLPPTDQFPTMRSFLVARAAAEIFERVVNAGDSVAFSGGSIILRMAQQLNYSRRLHNLRLYPLDVLPFDSDAEYNAHTIVGLVKLNLMGQAFSFGHHIGNGVQGSHTTERAVAMMRFQEAQQSKITFLGIGDPLLSNSTAHKKMRVRWTPKELKEMGAKAEILFQLIQADGSPCIPPDHESDSSSSYIDSASVPLERLRSMAMSGYVIGVATGSKAEAIRAVLKGGYLSGLVVDDHLAMKILDIPDPPGTM